jgi:hypothetical protein
MGPSRACGVSLGIGLALVLTGSSSAQTLDPNLWVPNRQVDAVLRVGGTLYVGGFFTQVGQATGGGVPLDASTAALPGSFPKVAGIVRAVTSDDEGGWIIGGTFSAVGGVPRTNVAWVRSDLTVAAWNPNAIGNVQVLYRAGSAVYAGGTFTSIGGQPRNSIASLDTSGGAATAWNPNANGAVRALAVSGSIVYAGGSFTSIGGQTRNHIAALDSGTGSATAWNPNADSTVVNSIALGNGTIYAGGDFTSIGGQSRNGIASLDPGTGLATAWNPNANASVRVILPNGSTVYAGGDFTVIGGQSRHFVAALSSATGLASGWNPSMNTPVNTLSLGGGMICAGGTFFLVGSLPRLSAALIDTATGVPSAWNPTVNGQVFAVLMSGGRVYVGGQFGSLGGIIRNHLAAFDAITGAPTAWNPNVGGNGAVYALAARGSTIYAAGDFTTIGGQTRNRVAAIDSTGAVTAWNPNLDNIARAISVDDTSVYVGGDFLTAGGNPRQHVAAFGIATGIVTPWDPGANNVVRALAVGDSAVYAGGDFASIGRQARGHVAALDKVSGLATGWNPNASGPVLGLVPRGSVVYAAGLFSSIGGQPRLGVAALDFASGTATAWNARLNIGAVRAVAVGDSTIYVGGDFTIAAGLPRRFLAAVDATSGVGTAWNPNPDLIVRAIEVGGSCADVGGDFTSVLGQPSLCLASFRIPPDARSVQPSHGGNAGVVTATITGFGFASGATAALSSGSLIEGTAVMVAADGLSLTATFDLHGAVIGPRDVVVTNPDAQIATLRDGFTIEAVEAPQLRVDLVGRDSIRTNYPTAFDLVVNNLGNVDALDVPVWLTGIPLGATVDLGFPLATPNRDSGEPDWGLDSLSFTSPQGRYLALVIPRIPPGSISRRVNLTIPNGVTSFRLQAAVTPPWVDGTSMRNCLSGAGVIQNPGCMGTQLTEINAALANSSSIEALSGIGVWAKIGWQCEGATSLTNALDKSRQVLEYMRQAVDDGTTSAACSEVLPPRWRDALVVVTGSSVDPNDKLGARKTLSIQQEVPYTVSFENLSTAAYPAHIVRVADNLDLSKLDPSTISLGAITIGNVTVVPSDPRAISYNVDVALRPTMSARLKVTVDRNFGQITWDFQSIDPRTGSEAPVDSGFLLANRYPPAGQGSVLFTARPRALPSGTAIQNAAAITFDGHTNSTLPWTSTVDNTPPASRVLQRAASTDSASFTVRWEAYDPALGPGSPPPADFKDFTIYYSLNGGVYQPWREYTNTTATAARFSFVEHASGGSVGGVYHYSFYSEAHDTCGNRELEPSGLQDTVAVLGVDSESPGPRLALEGAHPNPAFGAIHVWFTLPSREAATIDVIDVSGRRVLRREVGGLGPGRHFFTLGSSPRLRPGLYFLRLSQGRLSLSRRVVMIR